MIGLSNKLTKRMMKLLSPIKNKQSKKKDVIVRKSACISIVNIPEPDNVESYTVQEMLSKPGIYIEENTKDSRFVVIPQVDGSKFGVWIHETGSIEPINVSYWDGRKFLESNDDMIVMFSRPSNDKE